MESRVTRVVVDSDGLIALFHAGDAHAKRATNILTGLIHIGTQLIFPTTTLIETATLFQRRLKEPALAAKVAQIIQDKMFAIAPVSQDTLREALTYYRPREGSSHHTMFDAVVAATAKTQQADAIFSFDGWYKSLGFKLVGDLVAPAV